MERSAGVLLHPTSLPSDHGIGDLGQSAYDFVVFLQNCGMKLWQILPLNPPGYGESPYQCFSAFAGNALLISLNQLVNEGLLKEDALADSPGFPANKVDFEKVKAYKDKKLRRAHETFIEKEKHQDYHLFIQNNQDWLMDYAFFMALKTYFHGKPWNQWDQPIAKRELKAVAHYRSLLKEEIEYQIFLQYTFDRQWNQLKSFANKRGIKIIGDLPIFISYDSSDAWVAPHLFELDTGGNPLLVAGVPPDFFSNTGQRWGNPHFRWSQMEKDDFLWWRRRFKRLFEQVDIIRIDHFRGFEAYWEIPAQAKTAQTGRWVKAPGQRLFQSIRRHLGEIPIIVEDLGYITPAVTKLKRQFSFPGMKILQFSFNQKNPRNNRPHGFERQSVVYTGTHDNETILGWFKGLIKHQEMKTLAYLKKYHQIHEGLPDQELCNRLIEVALQTSSVYAIIPLQDILVIDNTGRMNFPGTVGGNWQWRFKTKDITTEREVTLQALVKKHRR